MQCLQHCHLYVGIYYLKMFVKKDSTIEYKPDQNRNQENMNQKNKEKTNSCSVLSFWRTVAGEVGAHQTVILQLMNYTKNKM